MTTQAMVAAAQFDHAALAAIFNDGYAGYEFPTHMDGAAFESMARLVDIDVARSVVALDGDRPVGFAMLALRGHRAWIAGMGVSPAARGRGLGTEVTRAVIANARAAGATTVDLEVLVDNAHAYRIYEALGFVAVRRLVVWLVEPTKTPPPANSAALHSLVPLDAHAAFELIDEWSSEDAPWQRAPETVAHFPEAPAALGFMHDGAIAGAVIYRAVPERVSILGLGAHGASQLPMLDALVDGVLARHAGLAVRLLNLPEGDPAEPAFERLGARAEAKQIHMRLTP